MTLSTWGYAAAFAASLALSLGLTPLALKIALAKQVLDRPGDYKTQESPVPYLGGVAVIIAFSVTILGAALLNPPSGGINELALILGCGVALGLVGLIDDIRGVNPLLRFGFEIAAAAVIWWSGVGISIFETPVFNALLTFLWIVGITNAFNLLDNMDGLSAGIAGIAASSFFLIAALNGQFLVAGLSIALAGCAFGFLRHNFHPARIYMGDAGSLFLGFVLAVLGIKLKFNAPQEIAFFVPILVLGIAIFDTTLVTCTRLIHRRSPFLGNRDHISHRLVFVGIPVRGAVSLVYAGGISLGWLGIIMSRVDRQSGYLLMAFAVSVALFMGFLIGNVPIYRTSKRRRMMIQEVAAHESEPPPRRDEMADLEVVSEG